MNGETQRFRKVVGGREEKREEEWGREIQSEGERKIEVERGLERQVERGLGGLECGRER